MFKTNSVNAVKTIGKVLVLATAGCLVYSVFADNDMIAWVAMAILAIYCILTFNSWR